LRSFLKSGSMPGIHRGMVHRELDAGAHSPVSGGTRPNHECQGSSIDWPAHGVDDRVGYILKISKLTGPLSAR
jgi:hypothetical protein